MGPDSDVLRLEYRREAFRWAAHQIRDEFQPDNWEAFWRTAIEDHGSDCWYKNIKLLPFEGRSLSRSQWRLDSSLRLITRDHAAGP